ncbi:MAG: hypothetical protein ACRC3Y_10670 [Romboutsia sp.]
MAKGSFNGLYTFDDIARIYKMDNSTLRKMVQKEKFIIDRDIKKFGKTWIITEDAVRRNFGLAPLQLYNQELSLEILRQKREDKIKKAALKSANKKVRVPKYKEPNSIDADEFDGAFEELKEIVVDDRLIMSSFNFGE